jgi:hypothetical protein
MQPQQYMQPPPPPAAKKTSGLAIAALVLGILGMCLPCPLGLVAVILGIVALVQMGKDPALGGKALAIIGIVLPLVSIPITAAIAIPNFIRFQARSKQVECKANLRSLHTAQQALRAEQDLYTLNVAKLGWSPERGNRYAYFLSATGELQDRSGASAAPAEDLVGVGVDTYKFQKARALTQADLRVPLAGDVEPGLMGTCPRCDFTAVCIGNVDNDDTLDVWSISSQERSSATGEVIPPGVPHNDLNDVVE